MNDWSTSRPAIARKVPARTEPALEAELVVARITSFIAPHKWRIGAICAGMLAVTTMYGWMLGPTYTAEVLLLPGARGPEMPSQSSSLPVIDPTILLESRLQLLQTQPLSRGLLEHLAGTIGPPPAARSGFGLSGLLKRAAAAVRSEGAPPVEPMRAEKPPPGPADLVAEEIGRGLRYTYQRRTYLITASVMASSPERAVAFANAVASQIVHDERLRVLADRLMAARRSATEMSATYGARHPAYARAVAETEEFARELEAAKQNAKVLSEVELEATGLVIPARSGSATRNARTALMLSGVLGGLLVSMALVLAIERRAVGGLLRRLLMR